MAPQIDEYTEIFLPNMAKFGFDFEFEVVKKGFFPKVRPPLPPPVPDHCQGGGEVNLFINPVPCLRAVELTDVGDVVSVQVYLKYLKQQIQDLLSAAGLELHGRLPSSESC